MKIKKQKINFTQVSNIVLNDNRLSAKAKGVYAYIFSKPDNWDFSIERTSKDFTDGYKAISSGIKELEVLGYIERKKQNNGRNTYYIYQEPQGGEQTAKRADSQKGKKQKQQTDKKAPVSNTDLESNKDKEKDTSNEVGETPETPEETKVEVYGNPEVNAVEDSIKSACKKIGLIYDPGKKPRQALYRLSRSRAIKDLVEASDTIKDVPDFIYKTIVLTEKSTFWSGKIFNSETFQDYYAKFLNDYKKEKQGNKDIKPKKKTVYG